MRLSRPLLIIVPIVVIVVALVATVLFRPGKTVAGLDGFATCLKDKGALFYGAFWCTHCQNQKKLFGDAAKNLPYVECSSADGQRQLPVCQEKGVTGYPTWTFADGSKVEGEVSLNALAEKTGCELPTATNS